MLKIQTLRSQTLSFSLAYKNDVDDDVDDVCSK